MKNLAATLLATIVAAEYEGCSGVRNEQPVLDIEPVSIAKVANGEAWKMQDGDNIAYIARIAGSSYEMGYAYGQLLGKEIQSNLENMIEYGRNEVVSTLSEYGIPSVVSIALYHKYLLPIAYWALDLNWEIALPYVPQRYIDEMNGIVEGSGSHVDADLLRRINLVSELT